MQIGSLVPSLELGSWAFEISSTLPTFSLSLSRLSLSLGDLLAIGYAIRNCSSLIYEAAAGGGGRVLPAVPYDPLLQKDTITRPILLQKNRL